MTLCKEFEAAMSACGFWEKHPVVAVGFSGGCDSLTLLRLTKDWCAKMGGDLVALHVNHTMRPQAGQEAEKLSAWCQRQGVRCVVLKPDSAPKSQKQARIARYNLMGAWCHHHHVHHLLVGHHQYDQDETVAMRCLRRSGVQGLMGMHAVTATSWGRLLRPLLDLSPSLWSERSIVDDPSNNDERYERVRVRGALQHQGRQLCRDVRGYAQELWAVRVRSAQSFFVQHVRCWRDGSVRILADRTGLDDQSFLWILERIIMTVSGKTLPARGHVLHNVQKRLPHLTQGKYITAGGCVFMRDATHIYVVREAKRIKPLTLASGKTQVFDGRFCVINDTRKLVKLYAADQKGVSQNIKSASLPVFAKKRSICKVFLVPCRGKVYGFFAPRIPLMGRRL